MRLLTSAILTAAVCAAVRTHAEPEAGLKARIAYYPGHDTLELRTSLLPYRTDDGKLGLRGEYFDNPTLEGAPVLTRVDRELRFNWKGKAPHDSLPADNFSARWTGRLAAVPWEDSYQFDVRHDDGVRVWIDGEKVLDNWGKGGRDSFTRQLSPEKDHTIRIEYRELRGGARIEVGYRPLGLLSKDLFHREGGTLGVRAKYFANLDLSGEPATERDEPRLSFNDFIAPGTRSRKYTAEWTTTFGPAPYDGNYRILLHYTGEARLWVDGVPREAWGNYSTGRLTARVALRKGESVPIKVQYRQRYAPPPRAVLEARYAKGQLEPDDDVTVEILREGAPIQSHQVRLARLGDREFVRIEPLEKTGMHTVRVGGDAYINTVENQIWHEDFEWEGNRLGITDRIYPPFEPVTVAGESEVRVVLRNYRFGGLGLPSQIEAKAQDERSDYKALLAAPIRLVANGEAVAERGGSFVEIDDRKAVYEGRGTHPSVNVTTRTTTEFDGCMKVELTLAPNAQADPTDSILSALTLDIPLKDEMAPLWHVVKGAPPIRNNPAGATPGGKGRVWASKEIRNKHWPGNFLPYIWLGGPSRGLAWFADNEKGWEVDWDRQPPCQTLHRDGGQLTLRVHLVQKPVRLTEPRTITFGLMASPAKPMPEGWRAVGRPDGDQIAFRMGQLFGLNAVYAAKYPRGKDFSPFEKFHQARQGKPVDVNAFVSQWAGKHLHDGMTDNLKNRFRNLLGNILRHGSRVGDKTYFTAYFDEFRATTTWHEEMKSYWSEWTREFEIPWAPVYEEWDPYPLKAQHLHWFRGTGAFVPSYRDFACWFAAKWLENGVGIYFDNTFMEPAFNLINTSAYVREDGRIQPSAGIWARRAYLRRIWNLHQELFQPETPQIMMLHMTNTHVLPYMVWNQSNLDLEWKLPGVVELQKKFSPELLLAESTGLQTGNIPLAMIKPGKARKPAKGMSKQEFDAIEDTYRHGLFVHEIKYAPSLYTLPPPEPVVAFGYGLDDCEGFNYWEDEPVATVSDGRCKWIVLKRDGRLLLNLVTWNRNAAEVDVALDTEALGVDLSEAKNAETNESVAKLTDGSFTVRMKGFGVRTLIVE